MSDGLCLPDFLLEDDEVEAAGLVEKKLEIEQQRGQAEEKQNKTKTSSRTPMRPWWSDHVSLSMQPHLRSLMSSTKLNVDCLMLMRLNDALMMTQVGEMTFCFCDCNVVSS